MTMHDDHEKSHDNPWADRINEAYYDAMGAEFGQKTRERINWMCAQARGDRVLDVGCSQGIASILMAREGMSVVGLDIFAPAIEYARAEKAKEIESVRNRLEFHCADLATFEGGLFDTVVMGEVIEHQTNPTRFIEQGLERLNPNGRIVITVPFGLHPWPDHKSTIFPDDVATALVEQFFLTHVEVAEGYIKVVADRRNGRSRSYYAALIQATEEGALEVQKKLYEVSADNQRLVKARADLETKLAASQAGLKASEKGVSDLEHALALRTEALTAAEAAMIEVKKELEFQRGMTSDLATARERLTEQLASLLQEVATYKVISDETTRRIAGLESEKKELSAKCAQLHAGLTDAEDRLGSLRGIAEEKDERHRAHQLRIEQLVKELEGNQETARAELSKMQQDLDGLTSRYDSLVVERDEAVANYSKQTIRIKVLEEELASTRAELSTTASRASRLQESEKVLRDKITEMRNESAIAQYKRHGHFAHLQAYREYSAELVQHARWLHDENERYQHSVALAIGRALLKLRSVRGVLGFPSAILNAWRMYRLRENGALPSSVIKLPILRPVSLPPPPVPSGKGRIPQFRDNSTLSATALREGTYSHDQHRKDLSVFGWKQEVKPRTIPVMSVLDEFSRSCFSPHASLIEPRPDNWEGLLEMHNPRFLFVESSWKGNYGSWQYRVSSYASPPGSELKEMVAGFRARSIPTVFWNKEDPVHYDNFIENASRFDIVLTTASEVVPRYEERTDARIGVLQFAAEESLHNPLGSASRNQRVCFAGSFYANRFHERRNDQLMLLDAASKFDFDIFDRNHEKNSTTRSDFAFPERFDRFVRGRLPYEAIGQTYRNYRVFLNVNSVIDSPTMFSRRVFELLACGTPVVSTRSRGTEETFGSGIVWHVQDQEEAEEAIRVLMTDEREWRRRSLAGIRCVLSAHTYRHRFDQICQLLGLEAGRRDSFDQVLVVSRVSGFAEASAVLDSFERQVVASETRKRLVLVSATPMQESFPDSPVDIVTGNMNLGEVAARARRSNERMLAVMSPLGVYGRHYLQDLLHAVRYSGAGIVGKPGDHLESSQYRRDVALDPYAIVIDQDKVPEDAIMGILDSELAAGRYERISTCSSDLANFVRTDRVIERGQAEVLLREIEF